MADKRNDREFLKQVMVKLLVTGRDGIKCHPKLADSVAEICVDVTMAELGDMRKRLKSAILLLSERFEDGFDSEQIAKLADFVEQHYIDSDGHIAID